MNKEEAIQIARAHLIQNVGNMVGPGVAYYDERDKTWCIAIVYQDALREVMIGELQINAETSKVSTPSREELLESLDKKEGQGATILISVETLSEEIINTLKQLEGVRGIQTL